MRKWSPKEYLEKRVNNSFFADLHLHSKWSLATSRHMDLEHMALYGAKKGILLLGTGDCTHPQWLEELSEKLCPAEEGLFALRPEIDKTVQTKLPLPCRTSTRFVLQGEVATIYRKNGVMRRVHHLIYLPTAVSAQALSKKLAPFGKLASNGRPIIHLDSEAFLELLLEVDRKAFLIPAHIWTPWYSVLGSFSEFSSIEACYGLLSDHIFALETGLSSDPGMNWRVSSLDRFQLVSNSDAHSPQHIGREVTQFSCPLTYTAIRNALQTGVGLEGTVEVFPEEGKYFLDGHRKCQKAIDPRKAHPPTECPVCGKKPTVGVMHRILDCQDRPTGSPAGAKPYRHALSLHQILSQVLNVSPTTKRVEAEYNRLLQTLGPELSILFSVPLHTMSTVNPAIAHAIDAMRRERVIKKAGYDGQSGELRTHITLDKK